MKLRVLRGKSAQNFAADFFNIRPGFFIHNPFKGDRRGGRSHTEFTYYKQKTGKNIIDAIVRKKIEYAKGLIASNRMKIYEIAQAVGFDDATYFSHVFRKYTGMTAKAYGETIGRANSQEEED